MTGFRRSVALGVAAVLLLGALAWFVFGALVAEDKKDVVVAPPPKTVEVIADAGAGPRLVRVRVARVVGEAERLDADGQWKKVTTGAQLNANDHVRALKGGSLELEVGDAASTITVPEGTDLTVAELSEVLHQFKIGRGRITVDYQQSGTRTLRVESESGAVAQTNGARFTVLSTGTSVAVAAERGSVDLTSSGQTVTVDEGKQSVALLGMAPSTAAPIPTDVLLKVARGTVGDEDCLVMKGSVRPGSLVEADGQPVEVDAAGRFAISVKRRPGLSSVTVSAREPSGTVKEQQYACQKVVKAPTDVKFNWSE